MTIDEMLDRARYEIWLVQDQRAFTALLQLYKAVLKIREEMPRVGTITAANIRTDVEELHGHSSQDN